MATYYLDNNVFVEIEQGNIDISSFLSNHNSKYYFSPSHIDELIEGERIGKLSVENRLKLIEDLASNNCIMSGFSNPELCVRSPLQVYQDAKTPIVTIIRQLTNHSISNLILDRDEFLNIIRMRKIEVNNIPSQDILIKLNDILLKYMNISISGLLLRSEAIGRTVFGTLFNLLDLACYYKDKQTEHSNIARFHDASHAYYAQLCDFFVSEDKRMRYKTKAVYSYLGIATSVLSFQEFKTIIET